VVFLLQQLVLTKTSRITPSVLFANLGKRSTVGPRREEEVRRSFDIYVCGESAFL
jgi:hypothetical protein